VGKLESRIITDVFIFLVHLKLVLVFVLYFRDLGWRQSLVPWSISLLETLGSYYLLLNLIY